MERKFVMGCSTPLSKTRKFSRESPEAKWPCASVTLTPTLTTSTFTRREGDCGSWQNARPAKSPAAANPSSNRRKSGRKLLDPRIPVHPGGVFPGSACQGVQMTPKNSEVQLLESFDRKTWLRGFCRAGLLGLGNQTVADLRPIDPGEIGKPDAVQFLRKARAGLEKCRLRSQSPRRWGIGGLGARDGRLQSFVFSGAEKQVGRGREVVEIPLRDARLALGAAEGNFHVGDVAHDTLAAHALSHHRAEKTEDVGLFPDAQDEQIVFRREVRAGGKRGNLSGQELQGFQRPHADLRGDHALEHIHVALHVGSKSTGYRAAEGLVKGAEIGLEGVKGNRIGRSESERRKRRVASGKEIEDTPGRRVAEKSETHPRGRAIELEAACKCAQRVYVQGPHETRPIVLELPRRCGRRGRHEIRHVGNSQEDFDKAIGFHVLLRLAKLGNLAELRALRFRTCKSSNYSFQKRPAAGVDRVMSGQSAKSRVRFADHFFGWNITDIEFRYDGSVGGVFLPSLLELLEKVLFAGDVHHGKRIVRGIRLRGALLISCCGRLWLFDRADKNGVFQNGRDFLEVGGGQLLPGVLFLGIAKNSLGQGGAERQEVRIVPQSQQGIDMIPLRLRRQPSPIQIKRGVRRKFRRFQAVLRQRRRGKESSDEKKANESIHDEHASGKRFSPDYLFSREDRKS